MELVTRRWGVTPLGVERGGERRERRGAGTGSGKTGDGIGETGHLDGIRKREKEEASEEVGRKGNVVDRLSTVNVSYPRVDCNSS